MDYTIIRNGLLHDNSGHDARPADILVGRDRIVEVGPPGLAAPAGAVLLDASDRLMIPGLVNAHTHGHGGICKGMGDRWTLELLLNAGPWLNGARTLEHKYLAAKIGALEMLRKGCTACYDLYFEFPAPTLEGLSAAGQAYRDTGMRAVIAPMVADRTFFEAIPGLLDAMPEPARAQLAQSAAEPADVTLRACEAVLDGWTLDRDWVRPALAPTIPLHCTDSFVTGCRDLARDYGACLHMHLAESKVQAVSGMAHYGKTLAAHLDDLDFLGERFTGAHCVWLDHDDIQRLADTGGSVAHNPGSNLRLGSGIAAARSMLDAGVNVGIGTDGAQCSDNLNMFEAIRFASFVSRVREHDPGRWLATEQVFDMATRGGARAMGFGDDIGRIGKGAFADIVFLDLNHPHYWPLNDPTNLLVHTEDGSAVHSVMTGGEMVVVAGEFVHEDMRALRAQAEAARELLAGANQAQREFAEGLEQAIGGFCLGLSSRSYHVHAMASVGERSGGR